MAAKIYTFLKTVFLLSYNYFNICIIAALYTLFYLVF